MNAKQYAELDARLRREETKLEHYEQAVVKAKEFIQGLMGDDLPIEPQHRAELATAREMVDLQADLVAQLRAQFEHETATAAVRDAGQAALAAYRTAPAELIESIGPELASSTRSERQYSRRSLRKARRSTSNARHCGKRSTLRGWSCPSSTQ